MRSDEETIVAGAESATVLQQVRDLVRPLARGQYVDDWGARATAIGSLSDTYYFFARENGHWSNEFATSNLRPFSLTPTRRALVETVGEALDGRSSPSLNLDFVELTGQERDVVEVAAARLDAAEKIVISASARSLHDLDNPPELTLELMNLLYEEALHLEAVGRLLGIDHATREWIPDDRLANWDLVKGCSTALEYMIIEHCLYEGRGTIASAAGVFELERAGASKSVLTVMEAISMQEAAHNISGFRWLKLLDTGSEEDAFSITETVRRFIAVEPLPEADGSSRSAKKHFPLYLFQKYRESGDFYRVKQEIVAASKASRSTGEPGIPTAEIYQAADQVLAWCGLS